MKHYIIPDCLAEQCTTIANAQQFPRDIPNIVNTSQLCLYVEVTKVYILQVYFPNCEILFQFFRMVCDKFSELTAGNPTLAKRKVLAGIVMTNDNDGDDIKVSIGSVLLKSYQSMEWDLGYQ